MVKIIIVFTIMSSSCASSSDYLARPKNSDEKWSSLNPENKESESEEELKESDYIPQNANACKKIDIRESIRKRFLKQKIKNKEFGSEPSQRIKNISNLEIELEETKCLHTDGFFEKIYNWNTDEQKIKNIDKLFEFTYRRLKEDYTADKVSNISIKNNVFGCIHKNRVKKSFGIFEKGSPSMIIFSITK